MKVIFINAETGEEMEGQFLIDMQGKVWEVEFGSFDRATEPTRAWAGEMWLVKHPIKIMLRES